MKDLPKHLSSALLEAEIEQKSEDSVIKEASPSYKLDEEKEAAAYFLFGKNKITRCYMTKCCNKLKTMISKKTSLDVRSKYVSKIIED